MDSETETYRLLKVNRENGIKVLFELYAKKLQNYARYKWKIKEDVAWDLVYKTIYKAADVVNEYGFESEQKFASFIFKMFINAIRDQLRSAKTAAHGITEVELSDSIINNYRESAKPAQPNDALLALQQELDKLEDWQRILLLMRSQDVPYSEIAKYVDKP